MPSADDLTHLPQVGDNSTNGNINDANSNDANTNDANTNLNTNDTKGNDVNGNDINSNNANMNDDNSNTGIGNSNSNDDNYNDTNSNDSVGNGNSNTSIGNSNDVDHNGNSSIDNGNSNDSGNSNSSDFNGNSNDHEDDHEGNSNSIWALALLGISDAFLYRMSITRAQSLSLGVLALGLAWMFEGKHRHLAVLAFLYVWMYDAFPLLLILAVLHLISIALIEHRLEYRPLLFIGIGIVLGMLINPYFPHNIIFSYRHMLPKLTGATSVSVGNEWYPYDTGQLLKNSLPALVAFGSGILALGLAGRKMDVRTGTSLLAALLFGLMLFQARRFIEYFPPFALIFAAFAWTPLIRDPGPATVSQTQSNPRGLWQRTLPAFVLAFAVIAAAGKSLPATRASIQASKPYNLYESASEWLKKNTPAGALVFQTDWDDFPRLFFYNTHNTYLAGLDPTYMQLYDPELYDLWVLITRGDVQQPSQFIANRFHAQYVHSDLKHGDFLRKAEQDPGLHEVYRDDQAVVFEVTR